MSFELKPGVIKTHFSPMEEELYASVVNGTARVGVLPFKPYAFPCFDQPQIRCLKPGIAVEVVQLLCLALSIKCQLIRVNHTDFGDNLTGVWRGMIRQIIDGEFDFGYAGFQATTSRLAVVDFSIPVFDGGRMLMTLKPETIIFQDGAVLSAFSPSTWILTIFAIVTVGLSSALFQLVSKDFHLTLREFGADWMIGFTDASGMLFLVGMPERRSFAAASIYFLVWAWMCVILSSLYSSQTLAVTLDTEARLPFRDLKSFAACIDRTECYFTARTKSSSTFERIFTVGVDHTLTALRESLQRHPPLIFPQSATNGLLDSSRPIGLPVILTDSTAHANMLEEYPCRFQGVVTQSFDPITLPFPKNSSYQAIFNRAIVVFREMGITDRLHRIYIANTVKRHNAMCTAIEHEKTHAAIPMRAFSGLFLVLIVASVLGTISMVIERRLGSSLAQPHNLMDSSAVQPPSEKEIFRFSILLADPDGAIEY